MPIYEYLTPEGHKVMRVCPVEDRDKVTGMRRIISTPNVVTTHALATNLQGDVMKGYYNMECRDGSRFKSTYTKKEIRQAWAS